MRNTEADYCLKAGHEPTLEGPFHGRFADPMCDVHSRTSSSQRPVHLSVGCIQTVQYISLQGLGWPRGEAETVSEPSTMRQLSLDQCPRRVGDELAVAIDLLVQVPEPVAVALHAEAGNDPDDFAQEIDDGADVEELHT